MKMETADIVLLAVIISIGVVTYFGTIGRPSRLATLYERDEKLVSFLLVNATATYLVHIATELAGNAFPDYLKTYSLFLWTAGLMVIGFKLTRKGWPRLGLIAMLSCTFIIVEFSQYSGTPLADLFKQLDIIVLGSTPLSSLGETRPSNMLVVMIYFINCFCLFLYSVQHLKSVSDFMARAGSEHAFKVDAIHNILATASSILAMIFSLALAGIDLKYVAVVTAIVSAGATAIFKDLLSNIAAGAILLMQNTIKRDHVLNIDKFGVGVVRDLNLRYTVFKNRDDVAVLIPNLVILKSPITHLTFDDENVRLNAEVGVAYDTDIALAKSLMVSVPNHVGRVLANPEPKVQVRSLNDFDITLRLCFWIGDPKGGIGNVRSDVFEFILQKFGENNIKIPYPRVDYTKV